ncbi:MAG: SPFH/Band 7/PHB domain protein [Abditibacteriota bacterium]|nr:SPFH/Band 7/PHB domain protein [Abditibacteriota bacterium]
MFFVIVALIVVVFISNGVRIVRPYEKGVVERLGSYNRTVGSGLRLILPIIDRMNKVDMREQVVDVPPQQVITKDNVAVEVDAVVYYEVTDPMKVIYNVANFYLAVTKLAQTNLRNLVGDLALDECLTSRDVINTQLREILDEATDKWGVRVTRVELQKIEPPADVTEAMHRQMKAERFRRAAILEAEGEKSAAILKSEGEKQARILSAEGEAEALRQVADAEKYQKIARAEGEGQAITTVFEAMHSGRPTNDILALKYMEALAKVADGKASKIFLPLEGTNMLGSIAGVAELFKDKDSAPKE